MMSKRGSVLTKKQDAYGRLVYDYFKGVRATEIVERDDGWIAPSGGPVTYFASYREWPGHQQRAMSFIRGRVLDIGCGPGRVALYLQQRGHSVLAIDNSPLAIQTARLRGVRDARVLPITKLSARLGTFDTIVLFGNNFGLFANLRRARWLLRRFARMTSPSAVVVAEVLDPYDTQVPEHRCYHRRNRARGRMAGQTRIRVRYQDATTPWFDYLFVSRLELRRLLQGSGWRLARTIDSSGPTYIAVLSKARAVEAT
jgi:SAM-dependent methyltransferase